MINIYNANNFCCDDIKLIENYKAANNDPTQTWHCHHRRETDLGLSRDELIEQGLYFNRPASELIFLTKAEHRKIHMQGENNPMYGYQYSEERRQKTSEQNKGENNPMYGKEPWNKGQHGKCSEETRKKQSENCHLRGTHPTWMNNGIIRVFPKTQEEIEHYRSLGYDFGFKLKT